MDKTIEIDDYITVGSLAELLSLPASKLIAELFKNGVMTTVNEKIDFDTAQIIVEELKLEVKLTKKDEAQKPAKPKRQLSKSAKHRPPVVAMMGHVDHGKTSLLDAIRDVETAKREAGGITQHLSAFQVKHNNRLITFLDTPGHEAFAALREHGARLTDLVVLVVAADDGVKPQTVEALRFARQAGVKIIVAANKIDKPEANLDKLKQQLSENQLVPEDWGGDTVVVPVSVKEKKGIDELLDLVLLVADIEELKADYNVPTEGLIIEAHMEQGRGAVAEALVEQGVLRKGDFITAGPTYGKIRILETTTGEPLQEAGPSTPIKITGLKNLPDFGDKFEELPTEKQARDKALETEKQKRSQYSNMTTSGSELLRIINRSNKLSELNVVLKADVQGSLTSVVDSLKTLDSEEVAVRIISSGVGVVTENDIHTAATGNAIIYGFNINMPTNIKRLAIRDNVSVRLFSVIYELIEDAKKELENLLEPEIVEENLGEIKIKGIFKTTKTEVICGGEVATGKISLPAQAALYRKKDKIADNLEVTNLKKGPTDVNEVQAGEMCGLSLRTESRLDIQLEDSLQFFRRSTQVRTL